MGGKLSKATLWELVICAFCTKPQGNLCSCMFVFACAGGCGQVRLLQNYGFHREGWSVYGSVCITWGEQRKLGFILHSSCLNAKFGDGTVYLLWWWFFSQISVWLCYTHSKIRACVYFLAPAVLNRPKLLMKGWSLGPQARLVHVLPATHKCKSGAWKGTINPYLHGWHMSYCCHQASSLVAVPWSRARICSCKSWGCPWSLLPSASELMNPSRAVLGWRKVLAVPGCRCTHLACACGNRQGRASHRNHQWWPRTTWTWGRGSSHGLCPLLIPCYHLCAFPDRCLPTADEPTSPKKARSISECHDLESWFSPPSPEWATVRVIPEEEMTEHNLLAIRVMVTSDTSRYFKIQVSL